MKIPISRLFICILLMQLPFLGLFSQEEPKQKKLQFSGDARFRFEQDWNSRKSDGTYRDDRFRMRFRVRAGLNYTPNDWASFGVRFRTGYPEKQQDPHLTIGDGYHEFESVPIGLDKLYFKLNYSRFDFWIGRNSFPFQKKNELFLSDNVSLDGLYLGALFDTKASWIDSVKYSGGIFTLFNSFGTFDKESFIGMLQIATTHWNKRLTIFPSFYHFQQMPDIPDGNETYRFNYSVVHLGSQLLALEQPKITLGLDLYQNLQNYNDNADIPDFLKDQKTGVVTSIVWGDLSNKGDYTFGAYFTYLERFAAVDFLAQNDWARWDYSGAGSRDGRLTNYKALELVTGYRLSKRFKFKIRYFMVEQLLPYGSALENGNRIRLDIDFRL